MGDETELRTFIPPLGPLNLRARALADWIIESFAPRSLFVCDVEGRALIEFGASADLMAGAVVLADAASKARRHLSVGASTSSWVLHAEIAPATILSLVTSDTTVGLFHVGLTGRAPHPPRQPEASPEHYAAPSNSKRRR